MDSAPAPREFKAFISYRHLPLDMAVAKAIQERIERNVVPRAYVAYGNDAVRVWLPESDRTYEIDRIPYDSQYYDPPYVMTLRHDGDTYLAAASEDSIYIYKEPWFTFSSSVS